LVQDFEAFILIQTALKVEGEVQGAPEDIDKIVAAIKEGPHHAHVVKLDTLEREAIVEGETSFVRKKTPY
jgi:acylphosphatase